MISHELWKSNTQTCCVRTGPMNIVKLLPKCVTSGRFRSQGGALWHNVHYKLKVFHIFTFFIFWNSLLLLNIQLAFYTKVVNIQTLPPGSGTWVICPRTRFLWKKKNDFNLFTNPFQNNLWRSIGIYEWINYGENLRKEIFVWATACTFVTEVTHGQIRKIKHPLWPWHPICNRF